jgi:hypothetical protein
VRQPPQSDAEDAGSPVARTCRSCAHFDDDPAHLEAEVPGILIFGSAYSSARGHAGMCRKLDRFLDPVLADRCPSYQAVDQAGTLLQRKNGERVRP